MRTPILLIFLFGFSIIYDVAAYPSQRGPKHEPADNSVYGKEHCVNMTPENEKRISAIVVKLSEYLYNLTIEHEVFDIRLLKIVIEGHSDDEVEEKDTQIQLVINDCAQSNQTADAEELQEILSDEDPYEKKGAIVVDFADDGDTQSEDENSEAENTRIRVTKYKDTTQQLDDDSNDTDSQTQVTEYYDNTIAPDNVDEPIVIQNEDTENDNDTVASDVAEESTADDNQATTQDQDGYTTDNFTSDDQVEKSTANNSDYQDDEPIANDNQATTQDQSYTADDFNSDDQAYESIANNNYNADDQVKESIANDNEDATRDEERYTTDDDGSEDSGIDIVDIQPSSTANFDVPGPVLVRLDLDKTGNKLIKGTQAKRGKHVPLVLYVQKLLGNMEYIFAN